MTTPDISDVFISLALVGVAVGVHLWQKLETTKDILVGTVRTFVQLIAIGYLLKIIFDIQSPLLIFLTFLVMTTVGAHAVADRKDQIKGTFLIGFVSIGVGAMAVLLIMLLLDVITTEARFIIPLGGMIIGNSLTATTLVIERVITDMRDNRSSVETALSLGKSWREASSKFQKNAAFSGVVWLLNFMKTVGLVAMPGTMTGMILAGADPLEAVYLQIIVVFMLLASVSITSVLTVELTVRKFFTDRDQYRKI